MDALFFLKCFSLLLTSDTNVGQISTRLPISFRAFVNAFFWSFEETLNIALLFQKPFCLMFFLFV